MFGLPDIGNPLYVIMLMIPFLLATSFSGLRRPCSLRTPMRRF